MSESSNLEKKKRIEAQWLGWGFIGVLALVGLHLLVSFLRSEGQFPRTLEFYITWEVSSIVFTAVLTLVHWRSYINRGDGTAYTDVVQVVSKKFGIFGYIVVGAILMIAAAAIAIGIGVDWFGFDWLIHEWWIVLQMACLTVGVFLVVVAEAKVLGAVPDAIDDIEKKIAETEHELQHIDDATARTTTMERLKEWVRKREDCDVIKDDVSKFLVFSDVPIMVAFGVLAITVFFYWWTGAINDSSMLPPFIAGAVALQLLYSNFVFYIEAKGEFPSWLRTRVRAFDLVTPMIQGRRGSSAQVFDIKSKSIAPSTAANDPTIARAENDGKSPNENHDDAAGVPAATTGDD